MEVALRRAEARDAAEWIRMRRALFGESDDHEREVCAYFAGTDNQAPVFVAERRSGGLAGFLEMGLRNYAEGCVSTPVAYIEGWYVDVDARLRGIGAALIRAAEAWARSAGHREIASDTALDNNVSIQAHKALGYQETDRIVCFRRSLEAGDR
jgi:aminoglycoside 6'-N-acetyltransferase I